MKIGFSTRRTHDGANPPRYGIRWLAVLGIATATIVGLGSTPPEVVGIAALRPGAAGPFEQETGRRGVTSSSYANYAASSDNRTWMFSDPARACAWLLHLRDAYEQRNQLNRDDMRAVAFEPSQNGCIRIQVNSDDPGDDAHPGDGRCEIALDGCKCGVRAALQEAQMHSELAMIDLPSGHYRFGIGMAPGPSFRHAGYTQPQHELVASTRNP